MTRIGESFNVTAGFNVDSSKDNVGVGLQYRTAVHAELAADEDDGHRSAARRGDGVGMSERNASEADKVHKSSRDWVRCFGYAMRGMAVAVWRESNFWV